MLAFGTHRVVSAAPARAAGRAAALAETGNHLGTALGLAALGTVGRVAAASAAAELGAVTGALSTVGAVAAGVFLLCAVANLAVLREVRPHERRS
ncbi:MAG: hypothetical protein IRY85_00625 [Micromonosporaceae bacterium]|nr:hypothetical protein [Micromonosporaceae bacterium]